MARGPLKFKEADVRRAIRAVAKEGVPMIVEIVPGGVIRLSPAPLTESVRPEETNPWDQK